MSFNIGELLGKGGFGNVFKATDGDGNSYAIKYFAQNQPMNADLLENVRKRFIKEVRIQKNINHPNIVPVIESWEGDKPSYLMPIATCSLADEIETNKPDVASRYLEIISDIALALNYLHSLQICHRDLKPQNILRFETDEGGPVYRISDFGLISLKESNLSNLTATGMRKGSDAYTAPEITQKLSTACAQTDVYSLACILHDIVDDGVRVPCGVIESGTSFGDIFAVATRADPSKRFPTAKSFVDAVADVAFSVSTPSVPAFEDLANSFGTNSEDNPEFWESVLSAVTGGDRAVKNFIFSKISGETIKNAIGVSGEAGQQIYGEYCDWVASRRDFPFEYCDVLCERILDCFESVDFERRFQGCYALLVLGTSHNRWHVEHAFMNSLGPEIDEAFAQRAAIEFRVLDKMICPQIRHLERSIDASIKHFHPAVSKAISEICV
ncbi:serine/threonine-protein kinase [Roseobacter sp. OBYS 0001]|uniref:serine/threonine protein kinase n=1 Tax=Roseobacter sp. OBYS 0001 TaxID=882651 RepID=UPI001C824441|nr:serine/threonine-protein kinase [Roseobacter sp. OBYS 0001]